MVWIYLDGSDIIVTYQNNILGVEDGAGAGSVSGSVAGSGSGYVFIIDRWGGWPKFDLIHMLISILSICNVCLTISQYLRWLVWRKWWGAIDPKIECHCFRPISLFSILHKAAVSSIHTWCRAAGVGQTMGFCAGAGPVASPVAGWGAAYSCGASAGAGYGPVAGAGARSGAWAGCRVVSSE